MSCGLHVTDTWQSHALSRARTWQSRLSPAVPNTTQLSFGPGLQSIESSQWRYTHNQKGFYLFLAFHISCADVASFVVWLTVRFINIAQRTDFGAQAAPTLRKCNRWRRDRRLACTTGWPTFQNAEIPFFLYQDAILLKQVDTFGCFWKPLIKWKKNILGWNLDAFDLFELLFWEKTASQDAGWSHTACTFASTTS